MLQGKKSKESAPSAHPVTLPYRVEIPLGQSQKNPFLAAVHCAWYKCYRVPAGRLSSTRNQENALQILQYRRNGWKYGNFFSIRNFRLEPPVSSDQHWLEQTWSGTWWWLLSDRAVFIYAFTFHVVGISVGGTSHLAYCGRICFESTHNK